MKKPTVVVALGGNALLRRGEPLEADIQRKNIATAAKTIALIAQEYPGLVTDKDEKDMSEEARGFSKSDQPARG